MAAHQVSPVETIDTSAEVAAADLAANRGAGAAGREQGRVRFANAVIAAARRNASADVNGGVMIGERPPWDLQRDR